MAIRHGVTDTDKHFVIDPVTRTIKNQSGKLVLIQYDHNSERFTFKCPRYVDEHDMSLCNKVEIHYINTGTGNSKSTGIYETDDLQISADDPNAITFSWLISQNATRHVGKLNFVIRFACVSDDAIIEYAWNTGIYSDIVISKSIYNGEEFVEDYIDVLEMWKQDLYSEGLKISSVEQTTTSTEDGGVNIVTVTMTDGSTSTIEIQNGSTGKQGVPGSSISTIERTSGDGSPGTTDTYTITLTDGSTTTFQVYNGANGSDGDGSGDMATATYDPQGKRTDIYQYVDDAVAGIESSGSITISDSVTTESSETAASSKAVKIAYDKAVEALNASGEAASPEDISAAVYDYLEQNPVEVTADNNFYATYGTTTSAEIEAAYAAGKNLYCRKGDAICPLYERYSANMHCFYRGGFYIYCNAGTWMEDCPYDIETNKVTEITADSTDVQYPSAKAVYTLINASVIGAIEGSY